MNVQRVRQKNVITPQGCVRSLEGWSADSRNSIAHEAGELGDLESMLRIN